MTNSGKKTKNIRAAAAKALGRVDFDGAWSNLALDSAIREHKLSGRDSAFLSALFYGALEREITLDACIAAHSKSPLQKMSPAVLEVLRTGFYQLLYMDSVPDRAAVAESVNAVRELGKAQAAGFVNAVLRSFLRSGKAVPVPEAPLCAALSVEYACPEPIVRLWLDGYGEAFTRLALGQSLGRPPVYVRVNTRLTTPEKLAEYLLARGVAAGRDRELKNCLRLSDTGALADLPEFNQGLFHVQDKASQLCAEALGAQKNDRVLDACAAPGGKSFTLAQLMEDTGEIVACDLREKRVGLVKKGAERLKIRSIRAIARDMTVFDPSLGLFDRVLCDAPCSGLGTIRRRPEIKRKNPSDFAELPELQYKILKTASKYCKKGARLIYSTCTLNPAENEDVARRFLAENPDFSPIVPPQGNSFRTVYGDADTDGFFIAAMERTTFFE